MWRVWALSEFLFAFCIHPWINIMEYIIVLFVFISSHSIKFIRRGRLIPKLPSPYSDILLGIIIIRIMMQIRCTPTYICSLSYHYIKKWLKLTSFIDWMVMVMIKRERKKDGVSRTTTTVKTMACRILSLSAITCHHILLLVSRSPF